MLWLMFVMSADSVSAPPKEISPNLICKKRQWMADIRFAVGGFYGLKPEPSTDIALLGALFSLELARVFCLPKLNTRVGTKASLIQANTDGKFFNFESNKERRELLLLSGEVFLGKRSWVCCLLGKSSQDPTGHYFSISLAEPFVGLTNVNTYLKEQESWVNFRSLILGIWVGPKVSVGATTKSQWVGLNLGIRYGNYWEIWTSSVSSGSLKLHPSYPHMVEGSVGLEVWF